MSRRILFVIKFREKYDGTCGYDGTPFSFGGLYHSALFVVEMLRHSGIAAKLVQVCDNNDIDREVALYRPTDVIIEGLWVVPDKFRTLKRLHPSVHWIVRVHSELPFIATEGIAMEWLTEYVEFSKVFIASNSQYATRDFRHIVAENKVLYLPNFYPFSCGEKQEREHEAINIGCFGVFRPLKNQLIQALAAIEFSRRRHQHLRFHINLRCEQGGESVLKNLRALVKAAKQTLVEHQWETREEFLRTLATTDVGMQVSLSETFDITAADTVSMGIPLVTSNEVVWSARESQASTTNTASILARLQTVTGVMKDTIAGSNRRRLSAYSQQSRLVWLQSFPA